MRTLARSEGCTLLGKPALEFGRVHVVARLNTSVAPVKKSEVARLHCSMLAEHKRYFVLPNVRAKRATTVGRQARAGENVPRTTGPGLVACRWRSA